MRPRPQRAARAARSAPAILLALGLLPGAAPAAADPGALLAQGCLGCHGPGGGGSHGIPGIAGRPAAETAALMLAFRDDLRPATIMNRIARGYTEAEIAALAAHFSRRD